MSMRSSKIAIVAALAKYDAIIALVPSSNIHAVERSVLPTLPAIEIVGMSSERTDRPLIRHQLSCEITVLSPTEDGADEALDGIVLAVRGRLSAAEAESDPIVLPDGATAQVELRDVRWSTTATDSTSSIIRGAAIGLAVSEVDEVGGE